MNKRRTSLFFFIISMLFFYLPLVVLVVYSFNNGIGAKWRGISFIWYKALFVKNGSLEAQHLINSVNDIVFRRKLYDFISQSDKLWVLFRVSISIAVASGFVSTLIGILGAIGLQWYEFRGKNILHILTIIPLVIPEIILGLSLLILFSTLKLKPGFLTIFIAHTTFNVPFVLLIVLSRLKELDYSIIEASYDLGASEFQTLTKVIIPAIFPAIISAFLIAVTLSFDDFIITFLVSGNGVTTLPLKINSLIKKVGISPGINAISTLLIGISISLTLLTKKLQKYLIK